jgi:hypothetical protein
MGILTPLSYRLENGVRISKPCNESASKNQRQRYSDESELQYAPNESDLQYEAEHGCQAPPAAIPIDDAVPMTFVTLSAIPAAPPKIACVMLGIKSMFTMKATNTMMQGMRFASHISIE